LDFKSHRGYHTALSQPSQNHNQMPRLISLVLISLLSAAGLAAAGVTKVLQCGASQYDPAHYTCFDGDFLCPIHDPHGYSDADVLLRCGDNCYSTNDSTCNGTSVVPLQIGENPLEDCGPRARFYAQDYVCIDGDLLCPIVNHLGYLRCGKACYDPFSYKCTARNTLLAIPTTCLGPDQYNRWCDNQGCRWLDCCEGL
ncbi:unnamed protein product, partial [Mycena citricolor]